MTRPDDVQRPWDLIVVGGGTAGIVGAKTAARFGARTLLLERHRTGGDCLWTGCVPSKALLAASASAAQARRGGQFGVATGTVGIDFAAVMAHVRGAIAEIAPVDSIEALEAEGVTVRLGTATFTDPRTVELDGKRLPFHQAIVATGASPAVPPIPGLASASYLTSDTVWDLEDLPEDLVVLGGGSIGCELGQAFARLGASVTLVEGAPRLIPREDDQASRVVDAALREDGIRVLTGQGVARVEAGGPGSSGRLTLEDGTKVPFGRLLVAVGRTPRTRELGLQSAGVEVDQRGFVAVNERLRTTNPRIWAAGDLTGHPQFTHTAGVHGSLAASNAVLGLRRSVDTAVVPRVTFTHPEVAAVGVPTFPLPEGLHLVELTNRHVDRAVTEGDTAGFTRLALDRGGRILGATVVGPRAGESLGELTLAVKQGLRARDLAATIHPYPTYNDGPWNAAIGDLRTALATGRMARGIAFLAAVRRWRLGWAR